MDKVTKELKKKLKRAKEDYKENIEELELKDQSKNTSLSDW